ncbi:conserved hypothetical protein [Vibrio crassostreae]|uniref:hypothetical protein n=1 Tax=Vibrio crassostreae TaxID=246167 RepID=UPI0005E54E4D|nr:hypothetical protein [Vibrio crassostreae]ROP24393.1 hypothetical protein EDB33_102512 [Vibrio crassostreae]ROP24438.1 hypothetical protein EDB34_10223 [Vibrio crassostreae]RPE99829.1 hypothetical protein EDB15_102512 [Vibrio crassostreae]RPF09963.1 hypothetical protein EDB14_1035 [Vibrio crassostreae]TCN74514.1 hypothetical protein EDB60_101390 [Vibrio crassostreae]
MKELLTCAMEQKQRTTVTSLFARNGFKIAATDFDDVTFERESVLVNVRFDSSSNVESISVLNE